MPQQKKSKKSYNIPDSIRSHIKEDELSIFEDSFNLEATKLVLDKIDEIMSKLEEVSFHKSEKTDKYELPSWSQYQADSIGYRRGLREIRKLITK